MTVYQQWTNILRGLFYSPWFIVAAAFVSFYAALGVSPLFDLDEGAFSEATREMLESGNFAATYLNGAPRYDKPILIYWLQALSASTFGINEFAFRLPSALAASAWVWVVWQFCRQQLGRARANVAALVMVNCLWVAVIGRAAIADALLNLWLTLILLDIYRYYQTPRFGLVMRVYLWMGLGLLTKGPIAVVVPGAVSLLFFISKGQLPSLLKAYFNPLGWLLVVTIVGPWLWMVYQDQGMGFFDGFLGQHNVGRFTGTMEKHGGSVFYYLLMLPIIVLPFSAMVFMALPKLKRWWARDLNRYLMIWSAVILSVFSFSKTQLPHYVLNGCVPLFILFACNLSSMRKGWAKLSPPFVLLAIAVVLPLLIPQYLDQLRAYDRALLSRTAEVFSTSYYVLSAGVLAVMLLIAMQSRLWIWQRLIALGVVQNLFIITLFMAGVAELQQRPVKDAGLLAKVLDEPVVSYGLRMPSFSVYRQAVTPEQLPEVGQLVYTRTDKVAGLQKDLGPDAVLEEVFGMAHIRLVRLVSLGTE